MTIKAIEYRDIPGWPGYRARSDGSVWSRKIKGGNDRTAGRMGSTWRELAQCPNASGYSCVSLFQDRKHSIVPVCYLILETFVGPRPNGMEVCHYPDANRRNSRLDNLRWDTRSANQQDRKFHGTVTRLLGEDNPSAVLTKKTVLEIVRRRNSGEAYRVIASACGTTPQNVCLICTGKSWTHVTGGALEKRYVQRQA